MKTGILSKLVSLVLLGALTVVVIQAIRVQTSRSRPSMEFIQVSVLARHRADYSEDAIFSSIPVISHKIIEETARDHQIEASVPVITYTSLPMEAAHPTDNETEDAEESSKPPKNHSPGNTHGNAQTPNNQSSNGNGNGNVPNTDNGGNQGNNPVPSQEAGGNPPDKGNDPNEGKSDNENKPDKSK